VIKQKNILVTTDLSDNAQSAMPIAVALAKRHQAILHVAYVEEPHPIFPTDDSITLPQLDWLIAARKEREQILVNQAKELAAKESLVVIPHVHVGVPAKQIIQAARDIFADCIVMCSHGRSGIQRVLFGSVTEEVLRLSECPVLCVKGLVKAGEKTTGPILLTTDLSNESLEALPFAIALAIEQDAKLHVLLVLEDKLQFSDDMLHPQVQWIVSEHQELEGKLQAFTLQLRDTHRIDVAPHVLHGRAAEQIVSLAEEIKAGCIVIASHGRSGIKRIIVGSVAEEVIRNSQCPVLAVRNGISQNADVQTGPITERVALK
jgi:nucleotide-binding universal stress UspA family protein